ncbi:excinuclease ABC subunit B [Palleronia sp. LCG004]|uniref:excinuclease ABC subunit B n=1 Tax=Palleronia sp. LCG004 TaxID=3079304 RepID=UPI0029422EA9|nr:excinuclease ABC subunit B [Palleronia sp. LCG004]WOI56414.1 excinuclease ABC subunit B [Palleronia sp. LCG004]
MFSKPMMWLLVPLALGACATPREACIRDAQSELRAVTRDISAIETDLARGYRLVRTRETDFRLTTCFRRTREGETFGYPCQKPVTVTNSTPIGIDYSEERSRLSQLKARQSRLLSSTEAGIRQCRAAYPAES